MTTKKTKAKTPAATPAKVPTKGEILEKLKQNDAKLPNTEQPIFELAQLNRSGFYWQFIGLCEQAEALANADSPPDKQSLIYLYENLVSLEKRINDAKANAEQTKAEQIRQLKAELEHAKKNAREYIDIDKALIMPLSSESLLNDPREFTLAEITAAVYRDFEILRCHQWEIIGIDETNKYHLPKSGEADSDETSFAKRTERIAQNAANPKVKSELLQARKYASKGAKWTAQADPNSLKIAKKIYDRIMSKIDHDSEFKAEKNKIINTIRNGKTDFAKEIILMTQDKEPPTAKTLNKWLADYINTLPAAEEQ